MACSIVLILQWFGLEMECIGTLQSHRRDDLFHSSGLVLFVCCGRVEGEAVLYSPSSVSCAANREQIQASLSCSFVIKMFRDCGFDTLCQWRVNAQLNLLKA